MWTRWVITVSRIQNGVGPNENIGYLGGPDVEDLLAAQAQMEQLEAKENVQVSE